MVLHNVLCTIVISMKFFELLFVQLQCIYYPAKFTGTLLYNKCDTALHAVDYIKE